MSEYDYNPGLFGLYRAIVTDVSTFKRTGKIKCRISTFYNDRAIDNLIDGYEKDKFTSSLTADILTYVLMPFGGGDNYGMFKLPPVNSVGAVMFMNGNRNIPIWVGGLTVTTKNETGKVVGSYYPTDSIEEDNNHGAIYTEDEEPKFNFTDETSFVIKTKTNKLEDFSIPSTMDWTKNPVENTLIMNADKYQVRHRITDTMWSEFKLYSNTTEDKEQEENTDCIKITYHIDDDKSNTITLNSDDNKNQFITIENKNGEKLAFMEFVNDDSNGGQINIKASNGNNDYSTINMNSSTITLATGTTRVVMSKAASKNYDEILLEAPKVKVKAEDIDFGTSGYYLVTSPNPSLGFTLQDGSLLASAKKIKA